MHESHDVLLKDIAVNLCDSGGATMTWTMPGPIAVFHAVLSSSLHPRTQGESTYHRPSRVNHAESGT